jgi:hypothetical protein
MYRTRSGSIAVMLLAVVLVVAVLAAPAGGCTRRKPPGSTTTTSTTGTTDATSSAGSQEGTGAAVEGATSIPPGSSFVEGGGGPSSYTFREEWRRALASAQQWRQGAYLVTASGDNVNSDGVPSEWSLRFVDAIPTDEILVVGIDPWGQITSKVGIDTRKVTDQLQPGDGRIPEGILDSDAAIRLGHAALSSAGSDTTGTTRLLLSFDRDGSGPYWRVVVEQPGGGIATASVNALTGQARVLSQ